ncbi:MAG: L,D-transpeptidase family protein [Muribaculaceae bacterium]|nr:L,D-transpeptidase family protein [Muribaculaceae bacterium]
MKRPVIIIIAALCVAVVSIGKAVIDRNDTAQSQLLEIYDVQGSAAKARLSIGGKEIFVTSVFIGEYGIGKQREGDRKTPQGTLRVKRAFGISPNPGTRFEYIRVTPSIFACGDREYYNQIVDTAALHHVCNGEDMFHMGPDYDYGLETDYNSECVYKRGAAIFIHCKGNKPYTAGCIAFDRERMTDILQLCDTTLTVIVRP